jgi:ankyrin repeat protein
MASYKNHSDVVRLLVRHHADCNLQESDGELTPLMIACSKGFDGVVDVLLSANTIDVNMCDAKGQTALFIACLHGHSEVLQALSVQRDIRGSITRRADHSSPLQVACMMSHPSDIIATILATNGTDVHHVNDDGHTAIHYAEEGSVHDVVLMLSLLGGKSKKKREGEDNLCQVCVVM